MVPTISYSAAAGVLAYLVAKHGARTWTLLLALAERTRASRRSPQHYGDHGREPLKGRERSRNQRIKARKLRERRKRNSPRHGDTDNGALAHLWESDASLGGQPRSAPGDLSGPTPFRAAHPSGSTQPNPNSSATRYATTRIGSSAQDLVLEDGRVEWGNQSWKMAHKVEVEKLRKGGDKMARWLSWKGRI